MFAEGSRHSPIILPAILMGRLHIVEEIDMAVS